MAGKMNGDYNGIQKCAILMIALGPERASKIFAHLKEEEIETQRTCQGLHPWQSDGRCCR